MSPRTAIAQVLLAGARSSQTSLLRSASSRLAVSCAEAAERLGVVEHLAAQRGELDAAAGPAGSLGAGDEALEPEEFEEAVELANQTEYGLAAAVQSGSQARGAAVAEGLHAVMVHINDQTVNEEPPAPFGGFKSSSNCGHFGGVGQLELWTEWQ